MTVGIYILIILILGYVSVYLREAWLDVKWLRPFTWLGILIHESAHALFCILTGGRVTGFRVTYRQGYVTHYRTKVPILGPMLTAFAPLLVGFIIIGIINGLWLKTALSLSTVNIWQSFISLVSALNPLTWQAWVLLFIFLNVGVMVGPSIEDLKSIWPLIIISFFIHSVALAQMLALVIAMILVNIILFIILIGIRIWLNKKRPTARRTVGQRVVVRPRS